MLARSASVVDQMITLSRRHRLHVSASAAGPGVRRIPFIQHLEASRLRVRILSLKIGRRSP